MRIVHDEADRKFEAFDDNGELMGEISYTPRDGKTIEADHTLVLDKFQGRGVAGKLLGALVDHAAATGIKIIPICSYVVAAFKKDPDRYRHVMYSEA